METCRAKVLSVPGRFLKPHRGIILPLTYQSPCRPPLETCLEGLGAKVSNQMRLPRAKKLPVQLSPILLTNKRSKNSCFTELYSCLLVVGYLYRVEQPIFLVKL